jgi:hypothetical protein
MRMDGHSNTGANGEFGIFGTAAAEGHAYTQHFASLKIECARR